MCLRTSPLRLVSVFSFPPVLNSAGEMSSSRIRTTTDLGWTQALEEKAVLSSSTLFHDPAEINLGTPGLLSDTPSPSACVTQGQAWLLGKVQRRELEGLYPTPGPTLQMERTRVLDLPETSCGPRSSRSHINMFSGRAAGRMGQPSMGHLWPQGTHSQAGTESH